MFAIGEEVVYPGHGVARISNIVEKKIGASSASFYELSFLNKEATILVPTTHAENVGLRALSSDQTVTDIFKILAEPAKKTHASEFTASNWNKRHKEYQSRLRTGSLWELSKIYRDLRIIESQKEELSFGEKNLLQKTEALLVEEISLVKRLEHNKALEQIRQLCAIHHRKRNSSVL